MQVDQPLAFITRRLGHIRGSGRLVRPLKRWCSQHYSDRDDRWAVIHDYRGHLTMKVDRGGYMGGAIYWLGGHHRHDLDYLQAHLSPSDVFVDAGANMGEFTLAMGARVPQGRVLAFEPQPEVRAILRDNVKLNLLANVSIFDFGLADQNEQVELYTSLDRAMFDGLNEGLYTRFADETRNVATGAVALRPFDEVAREQNLTRLDWMKVDIEGSELSMLRGATETLDAWRPNLLIEINEPMFRLAGYRTRDLLDYLQPFGYQAFSIKRNCRLVACDPMAFGDHSANVLFTTVARSPCMC